MPKPKLKTKTRTAKKRQLFNLDWRLVLIFILLIAVVGIIIIRLSQASAGGKVTNTYSTWHFKAPPQGFNTMQYDFTVLSNPGDQGYFWAMDFIIGTGGANTSGYIGLQTKTLSSKTLKTGPGVVFSIWGATEGSAQTPDGNAARFNNEGSGFHTSTPYPWKVNNPYQLIVQKIYDGRTAYIGSIKDLSTGQETYIGKIYARDSSWRGLIDHVGAFTEYYGGSYTDCASITPPAVGRWGNPFFNGNTLISTHSNSTEQGQSCANLSRFNETIYGVEHIIGWGKYNLTNPVLAVEKKASVGMKRSNDSTPVPVQKGTLFITKYTPFGPGYPNITPDGNKKANPETAPGNTNICVQNRLEKTFACGSKNPFDLNGLYVQDSPYNVFLTPPSGWRVSKVLINGDPQNGSNQVKGVSVSANKYTYLDFYFDR